METSKSKYQDGVLGCFLITLFNTKLVYSIFFFSFCAFARVLFLTNVVLSNKVV